MIKLITDILKSIDYSIIHATIRASTPVLFAAMAAVITNQANILNVGIEGIMLTSAFTAVWASIYTGSWLVAVILAVVVGILMAWIISVAHIKYNADIMAVGTVINMLALAITKFLLNTIFNTSGSFYSNEIVAIPTVNIAFLEKNAVINSLFNNYSLFEIFGIILVFVLWFILYKTVWGLRIRSVGEMPLAAETAGINVTKSKYQVLIISGILAGVAGAHLSLGYSNMFVENMTNGRGFTGVASMFFGGGNPIIAWVGSLIFGFADSVGSRLQSYGWPSQFVLMLPYITTITVLAISLSAQIRRKKKLQSSLNYVQEEA